VSGLPPTPESLKLLEGREVREEEIHATRQGFLFPIYLEEIVVRWQVFLFDFPEPL